MSKCATALAEHAWKRFWFAETAYQVKEPVEHAHFTGCLRKWEVLCLNQSEWSRTAEFRWVDQVHLGVSRHSKGPEGGARASHLSFWVQHSNGSLGGSLCLCAFVCVQSSAFRPDSLQRRLKVATGVVARLQGLAVPVNDSAHMLLLWSFQKK